jgi:hypothetical protein
VAIVGAASGIPTGRTTRLGVVVGEDRTFGGQLVDVRRSPCHQASVVGADIPHADVVAHDDDDVGFLCRQRRTDSQYERYHEH